MPEPLIVLGPPRSFTSVVSAMVGQHPEMYGLPEVHLFVTETLGEMAFFYMIAGRRRQDGLLRVIAELYMGKQTIQTVAWAKNWLREQKDVETGTLFHQLADKVAPRILVEKSVSTIWRQKFLEKIPRVFPNARFLYLTRHPRAQGKSMLEAVKSELHLAQQMMDKTTDPPTVDPQILWYDQHTNILNFLETIPPERKLQMRGEDILSHPDEYLKQIAAWMGLREDPEAIEEMKHPERSPYSNIGPKNAPFGSDPKFLQDPVLHPSRVKPQNLDDPLDWRGDGKGFTDEVKELASKFGYT